MSRLNYELDSKTKTAAILCGRFCFLGASRLRVEPPVPDWENLKGMLDGNCLQQGAGVSFCLFFRKNHDSPEAGGDQQASTKWAAGGLQLAEANGAGMEWKVVERSEALE